MEMYKIFINSLQIYYYYLCSSLYYVHLKILVLQSRMPAKVMEMHWEPWYAFKNHYFVPIIFVHYLCGVRFHV